MSLYWALYNVVGTAAAAISLPLWLPYVLAKRKYRLSLLKRCGMIPAQAAQALARKPNIWIHAVSVGEVELAGTLLERLRPHYPGFQFVLTVTTLTGFEVAQKRLGQAAVVLFFPIEFWPVMNRVVRVVRPVLALIVETEIWPNFIYALDRLGVPCAIVNGRLSAKSFANYLKVKPMIRDVLNRITRFNMQSEQGARRLLYLGVAPERVQVLGNIKFDAANIVAETRPDAALLAELQVPAGTPIFLAAALEKTGQEDPVALEVLAALRTCFPNAALMIVPRHPARGPAIAELVRANGFVPRRRSQGEVFDDPATQVFIVDTVGELRRFYTLATTVFVGKSLFPPGGGQNMIEPVALGVPTVYGPYTANFRGIADTLAEHDGARIVADQRELAARVIELWEHPEQMREMVTRGQAFIRSQQGATAATVRGVLELLPPPAAKA